MSREVYKVWDLIELIDIINRIATANSDQGHYQLWFRGHSESCYTLLPSLLREMHCKDINESHTYNNLNLSEELRLQCFKSRVFHLIDPKPMNAIEWTALYQHHFGKTRFLDWTESLWTALSFALEAFLDPRSRIDIKQQRTQATPVLWALDPRRLNCAVYDFLKFEDNKEYLQHATMLYEDSISDMTEIIMDNLQKQDLYQGNCSNVCVEPGEILNLGVIDASRRENGSELPRLLASGEFNPYFYLCLRYYVDALPVVIDSPEKNILPPLAVLHQYQNERIRTQRGTFTVFPNYHLCDWAADASDNGFNCCAMERQSAIQDCLYEIRIINPPKMANELMNTGVRQTGLYPESDYYSRDIEPRA